MENLWYNLFFLVQSLINFKICMAMYLTGRLWNESFDYNAGEGKSRVNKTFLMIKFYEAN